MTTRRDFLVLTALGVAGCRMSLGGGARDTGAGVYVGTYTNDGRSRGIHLLDMDAQTGALRPVGLAAETENPSFLARSADDRCVYAVNETTEYEGAPSGSVSAFARDGTSGMLTLLSRQPSRGGAPCYVALDRAGRHVLVANYVGGSVAVYPVRADGGIGEATAFVQHVGKGTHPERQDAPHAHCIMADPSNRHVLVADLGLDRIMVYAFDPRRGTLSANAVAQGVLAPGSGPRHFVFQRSGHVVYVVNELSSTITTFRYDPGTGGLAELQTIPTVSEPHAGVNAPGHVHVDRAGRFVYMSNRGHDSIAVFAVDADRSTLRPVQLIATGGSWPRHFAMDPSGRFLYVANQRSDSIVGFRVDATTGRLAPTGQRLELPAPVCVRFAAPSNSA